MTDLKQVFWLCFTLMMLGFAWHFNHPKMVDQLNFKQLAATIDSTASGLEVHQFDVEGHLTHVLASPSMKHMPKHNVHVFQSPCIKISQKDEPSWEINAQQAKSFNGGKRIVFINHVVVHQQAQDNMRESTLKTERLSYYPKEKKASTNRLVTYVQAGNFIQSLGMNAYLDEKKVELLHQARGIYDPKKA